MGIRQIIGKERLFLDGAMGTMLQKKQFKLGDIPECLNFTHKELIKNIHIEYLKAGSHIVTTNTFGANAYKMSQTDYTVAEMIAQAVQIAKEAINEVGKGYIALDIGSTGKLLEPIGDVTFEEIYDIYKEQVQAGVREGVDLVLLETFTDLYELKAAVLAVKENSQLPIIATMSFEQHGRTFFGTSLESMVLTLEGLGVDVIGINCSLGPKELEPVVRKLMEVVSIPVAIQPNAGLPVIEKGIASYNITPEMFVKYMEIFADLGVSILGGCCGTTPEYIRKMINRVKEIPLIQPSNEVKTAICSASQVVDFEEIRLIGERLNPTGKKLLKEAIKREDEDYILQEAIYQKEEGADILDINMGLPDIDEVVVLAKMVKAIQGVVDLPLQIDSSNAAAIEQAVRIYNGKPLINSVNGKQESMDQIFPIAKKYGAAVLGLTLDGAGIPETAKERLAIARRIVNEAQKYGIKKEDILIDCLMVTASAQQNLIKETLKAIKLVKKELGVKTVLGVSNVSFGLPNRPLLNRTMLTLALNQGLDAPILNTKSKEMIEVIDAYRVLTGRDENSERYIEKFSQQQIQISSSVSSAIHQSQEYGEIQSAIIKGLKEEAGNATKRALHIQAPLEIIEKEVVPALNTVGERYERQALFLPQLIKSAEAAKSCFEQVKKQLLQSNQEINGGPKVIVATVYGDIHDIGKNIVKVILQNYNFDVIDLGKDVPKEKIVEVIKNQDIRLVGLSALMTTTVASMKETITYINQQCPTCQIVVGGAVLTRELSEFVGANHYGRDAMEMVKIAQIVLNK